MVSASVVLAVVARAERMGLDAMVAVEVPFPDAAARVRLVATAGFDDDLLRARARREDVVDSANIWERPNVARAIEAQALFEAI
jgi:hypothetical protein